MNVMDQRITKQIIGLQKATFDNAFSAMAMFQDQAEKTTDMLLESIPWSISEEEKRRIPLLSEKAGIDWD